ncbi:MAG: PAS domain S-box protein [Fimbriimonas sp.]
MERPRQIPSLSTRERQLVEFAAQGFTDTAIALKLEISEATVGTYWGRVRTKMGPYNRTELVSMYLRSQQEAALSELREENAKLIADLQDVATAASEEGSLYLGIIENAPDAILLVAEDGTIRGANLAARELFGYETAEIVGASLLMLMPERFRERHREHREEYVRDPRRRAMGEHLETPALRKDGTEFFVRATLSAMPTPSGLLVTCVLREVPRSER